MIEEEFEAWLAHLCEAEKWLQAAFELMDGIEGYSSMGEQAHTAALSAIRTVRNAEIAVRHSR